MKKIIVTFTDLDGSFYIDLEVPTDIAFQKLRKPIIETLRRFDGHLSYNEPKTVFLCNRTGKGIDASEKLENAGVWNGDYITVVEM